MSQFVVFVNGPAYGSQHAYSALRFCQAAIAAGHQLRQVFFYQDGIHNASALLSPASDEFNMGSAWQQLNQQGVELVCCVSAALRRGVVDDQAAADIDASGGNVASPFSLGGLGEYVTAAADADRVVQFG
ncbi:sulfurtransferase complex subunit TusD [Ferrimonas lipolytica]|uniref:Sulfurtransferase complex subunit TusD n=1 Tax=Ferrimonas lipolytica TaxID=2724191 RepID=A0A6H1UDS0_9GAMM|nr:sulfurtransferase complex subunit TusD [Ferrimonas lipolytica]QIZ76483.1 sulfurtransferase complex subunit TusD [Ferrimonas lipolytica]